MNLGEKIKALRSAKLMTQAELAGNEITRNMLSRIENGAAQPSLDTLRYIAAKLNVSPGFLLAEPSEEQMYKKRTEINGIKAAYLSGDHRICRDMCLNSESANDDEIKLILAECTKDIAVEEFFSGSLRSACEYLDLAIDACSGTIYSTNHIFASCAMYFKYMRYISATLSSNYIDETEIPVYASLDEPFCVYAGAFLAEKSGEDGLAAAMPPMESQYGLHLDAIERMKRGDYQGAYERLHRILITEEPLPEPVMYFVFCDLEICCKEIGDFKKAYEYSIDKVELLQKMLS